LNKYYSFIVGRPNWPNIAADRKVLSIRSVRLLPFTVPIVNVSLNLNSQLINRKADQAAAGNNWWGRINYKNKA